MQEIRQVRLCGYGGQGVVLAGTILGYAAIKDGKWVAGSSSYGAQARGGYARADVIISDRRIVFPHVIEADILISMSQPAYDAYSGEVSAKGIIFYDSGMISPKKLECVEQVGVAATSYAVKEILQKQSANMIILGACLRVAEVVTKSSFAASIHENVPERFREANLKAFELGWSLGEHLKGVQEV